MLLLERFAGWKYILEIEAPDERAGNALERKRRKAFYLRAGLRETGLRVRLYHVDYELLTPDGALTFAQYRGMLVHALGETCTRMLAPQEIEKAQDGQNP